MTRDLYLAAARRLVSQANPDIETAARRLVESASKHDIDFSLCFGTLEPAAGRHGPIVRQVCLAVLGAGRTAMLFISEPVKGLPEGPEGLCERKASINCACEHLAAHQAARVRIAQALPEPEERWAVEAFFGAGFQRVGNLLYMRAEPPASRGRARVEEGWPAGVAVERVSDIGGLGSSKERARVDGELMQALDASYIDTLDCPELCGLRTTEDVLDSHRSTGSYDPAWWWLVRVGGKPAGAMLLNRCPDQKSVELAYLGLGPEARGKGLGKRLLAFGLDRVRRVNPGWIMTCAVDERNTPALRLYASLGFEAHARRCALVRPIGVTASGGADSPESRQTPRQD
ncbi:hypothetical protein PHYC_01201 [Phycisphaerales bacterium]|nr:hypothetical protein PHYC_01201 [Phycisphaerales bacterium]